jgi:hypothetical protein
MSFRILSGLALLALATSATAVDLKDLARQAAGGEEQAAATGGLGDLGGLGTVPGLSLPGISGDTASNAAGVLQYCIERKFLGADAAASVKDKLMSGAGLGDAAAAEADPGYRSGAQGLLQGSDGQSLDLDSVSGPLKDKACDYVLDNASSLI